MGSMVGFQLLSNNPDHTGTGTTLGRATGKLMGATKYRILKRLSKVAKSKSRRNEIHSGMNNSNS